MEVNTLSSAALWLWSKHNEVNNRLAGRSQHHNHNNGWRIIIFLSEMNYVAVVTAVSNGILRLWWVNLFRESVDVNFAHSKVISINPVYSGSKMKKLGLK